jgi:immune inhibitor A
MGGGSWNGRGEIPAHPSAWCKVRQGWVTEVVQKTNATVKVEDVKTSKKVYRLWKDGAAGKEYFLLENRPKTGYDAELPAGGLLIWHIDDAIDSNSDEAHPKVALVQADNKRDMEQGNNRGDPGDPYPGAAGNTAFTAGSTPNSNSYAHADTNVSVSKITITGDVVSAQLAVKPAKAKEGKEGRKERTSEKQKEFFKDFFDSFYNWQARAGQPEEAMRRLRSPGAPASLEARIAELEARLAAIEPFIDQSQRPDLRESALEEEEDIAEIRQQMEDDILRAKRLFDSKPREY